jgi:hypothetical protein
MIRILKSFAIFLAVAQSAAAQTLSQIDQTPVSIMEDLKAGGTVDGVRAWPINWNGDAAIDILVQVAFVLGGNAVELEHRVYVADGRALVLADLLDLSGAIDTVTQLRNDITLGLFFYNDGDARRCPTGLSNVTLRPNN